MMKILDQGVVGEEMVPDEEHEIQEGTELDCPAMAYTLGAFAGTKAELEPQLYQVGNMPGLGVRGGGPATTMEWTMPRGVDFYCLTGGVFCPISFELGGKVLVQADVSLGVRGGGV